MFNAFSNSRQGAGSIEVVGSPAAVPGLGLRAQGSLRRAGDARTAEYVLRNTSFFERSAEVAAGYSRGALEFEAHASHFGTDLGVYRGSHFNTFAALDTVLALGRPPVDYEFSYEIGAPKQTITHDLAAIRGRYLSNSGSRYEAQYGFQLNHRREFDADRPGGRDPLARPAFDLTLMTHTVDTKLQTSPRKLGGSTAFAVVGLSGMNQANRSGVGYLIPNFRAYTGGVFARATLLNGPLTLEAGSRVDIHELAAYPHEAGDRGEIVRTDQRWTGLSGALGAIWQIGEFWSVASNLSAAWRPPSVNELYSYGVHHGTAQFEIGTASLQSENSIGLDATVRHAGPVVQAEASVYANRIADYIFLQPSGEIVVTIRGVFPEFTYGQVDALLAGFDGGLEAEIGGGLSFETTLAVVRGTDTSSDVPLLQMPADRVGLGLLYHLPDFGFMSATELEFGSTLVRRQHHYPTRVDQGGEAVSLDYAPPPDGYVLFRAGIRGELVAGGAVVQFSLGAENLFDVSYRDYLSRYRYFAHDVGRNVVLRLQVPFGSHQ
jgi:iron complex outermembrane receptor protein